MDYYNNTMITTLKVIPSHYRQLKQYELVKRGDLATEYRTKYIYRVTNPVPGLTQRDNSHAFIYYRRRHVRVVNRFQAAAKSNIVPKAQEIKKPHPVEKNPLVSFIYPHDNGCRAYLVRLIGVNSKYFVGLDVHRNNQYKKFLKKKAGAFRVEEFNPSAIK
jgi:hypothetical protein